MESPGKRQELDTERFRNEFFDILQSMCTFSQCVDAEVVKNKPVDPQVLKFVALAGTFVEEGAKLLNNGKVEIKIQVVDVTNKAYQDEVRECIRATTVCQGAFTAQPELHALYLEAVISQFSGKRFVKYDRELAKFELMNRPDISLVGTKDGYMITIFNDGEYSCKLFSCTVTDTNTVEVPTFSEDDVVWYSSPVNAFMGALETRPKECIFRQNILPYTDEEITNFFLKLK